MRPSNSFMFTDSVILHRICENFDLLETLKEESGDHQSHSASSAGEHECFYEMSWQFIQHLLRSLCTG